MKITVFIGHHKVGSTALQDFFARNFQTLIDHGILYPMVEFEGLTLMFGERVQGSPFASDFDFPINAREPHNALAFKMLGEHQKKPVPPFHKRLPHTQQMFHAIDCQIAALKPEHVVLVSEVMANFGATSKGLIERLKHNFPDAEFQFIVTLRRVDEYLMSWHSQRLRFGHRLEALDKGGFEKYLKGIHFDYRLMLAPWIEVFPNAKFIIRNHADVMKAGGSINDFMAQSGLSYPSSLAPPHRANPSYHRAIFDMARMANNKLSPKIALNVRNFLEAVTPFLELPKSSEVDLIGQATRQQMYELFVPIHEFLNATTKRTMFFPDIEEARVCGPIPYSQASQIVRPQLEKYLSDLSGEARAFFQTEVPLVS